MKMQKLMGALILILMLGVIDPSVGIISSFRSEYERLSSIGICQRGD